MSYNIWLWSMALLVYLLDRPTCVVRGSTSYIKAVPGQNVSIPCMVDQVNAPQTVKWWSEDYISSGKVILSDILYLLTEFYAIPGTGADYSLFIMIPDDMDTWIHIATTYECRLVPSSDSDFSIIETYQLQINQPVSTSLIPPQGTEASSPSTSPTSHLITENSPGTVMYSTTTKRATPSKMTTAIPETLEIASTMTTAFPEGTATSSTIDTTIPAGIATFSTMNTAIQEGTATSSTIDTAIPNGIATSSAKNTAIPNGTATSSTIDTAIQGGTATSSTIDTAIPNGIATSSTTDTAIPKGIATSSAMNTAIQEGTATSSTIDTAIPKGIVIVITLVAAAIILFLIILLIYFVRRNYKVKQNTPSKSPTTDGNIYFEIDLKEHKKPVSMMGRPAQSDDITYNQSTEDSVMEENSIYQSVDANDTDERKGIIDRDNVARQTSSHEKEIQPDEAGYLDNTNKAYEEIDDIIDVNNMNKESGGPTTTLQTSNKVETTDGLRYLQHENEAYESIDEVNAGNTGTVREESGRISTMEQNDMKPAYVHYEVLERE